MNQMFIDVNFMNVEQLRTHYGVLNNSQLAKKIGRGRSTIKLWQDQGIPYGVQAIFQLETKGELLADQNSKPKN